MIKSQVFLPRIVITMGEAAGVGAELLVKIAQLQFHAQLIVLADSQHLHQIAQKINLPLTLSTIDWEEDAIAHQTGHLYIEEHSLHEPVILGKLSKKNAQHTLTILNRASELSLNQQIHAIVTAPVHKANINQIESSFLGHTEFFANLAGVEKVVMMLASGNLRIALATTHIPLAQVSQSIKPQNLTQVLNVIINSFKQYNLTAPKIAVCGLNPHAGENGLLGKEDDQIIRPVIETLQQQGHQVSGPYPADTLFTPEIRKKFDVFLAMYHDQGLPVVKAIGFGQCANITLGLPYIRTSVDHGSALDIAADHTASAGSMVYAINYAIQLAAGQLPQ